ncbi:MAG: sodium-dependent bicarbonate transport family permease [Opitutus sp.]|nr:sodium-dependent bicarbonate transport family permease [Opitutus sp.]
MDLLPSLLQSLFSPVVLAFLLGIVATLVRSDLKIPEQLYAAMTIYLLFAIGLKGGAKLEGLAWGELARPMTAAMLLCLAIPVWSFAILRRIGRFSSVDSAAIAAHYASVSVVTFGASLTFLDARQVPHEGFLPALLALMEVPGIIVALLLARVANAVPAEAATAAPMRGLGFVAPGAAVPWGKMLHELLTSKGILLLLGGLAIGFTSGQSGYTQVAPFFDGPFRGVLMLFLLEIGLVTGRRLQDLKHTGFFIGGFALVVPFLHGLLGVWLGQWAGLSVGGATVLGTLAASASYIAAPAAVRVALPQANPALYLTASLAITFPFNVVLGIPAYFAFARWLYAA